MNCELILSIFKEILPVVHLREEHFMSYALVLPELYLHFYVCWLIMPCRNVFQEFILKESNVFDLPHRAKGESMTADRALQRKIYVLFPCHMVPSGMYVKNIRMYT